MTTYWHRLQQQDITEDEEGVNVAWQRYQLFTTETWIIAAFHGTMRNRLL